MKIKVYLFLFFEFIYPVKFLHLSFHKGCIKNLEQVATSLGIEIESLYIPELPPFAFDGVSKGNVLYNITHQRAENIWKKNKEYFQSFDGVITSDTTPLSRIFLQNNWQKPLIIWVCNRFDYYDGASLDAPFPDDEFYQLISMAKNNKNVALVPYNNFEIIYAKGKGIDLGNNVIKPLSISYGANSTFAHLQNSNESVFFIPKYHNNFLFVDLMQKLSSIPVYSQYYNGPEDIKYFKGVINIPGAWSNFHFFENIYNGLVYFVPSLPFLKQLITRHGNYYIPNYNFFDKYISESEWYSTANAECIVYFNSWEDLVTKVENTDYTIKNKSIKRFAQKHNQHILEQWQKVFKSLME